MAFEFTFGDFNRMALEALKANDNNFENSRVADRLRTVFGDRQLSAPSKSDSFELRRNLAKVINEIYDNGAGGATIPESVARALNVNKTASGFKLAADGSLVATNHPLTERRLVSIMTAIKLDVLRFGVVCDELDTRVSNSLSSERSGSPVFEQFALFAKGSLHSLTQLIRSAADGEVKPAVLRAYLPTLKRHIEDIETAFEGVRGSMTADEAKELEQIINLAADIARDFGAEVSRVKEPIKPQLQQVVAQMDPEQLEVVDEVMDVGQQPPSAFELLNDGKRRTIDTLGKELGDLAKGIELEQLVMFSSQEMDALACGGENADDCIKRKVDAIVEGARNVALSELDDADRKEFIKKAILGDGAVDKAELDSAVAKCRTRKYQKIAADRKACFDAKVAEKVLAEILADEKCAGGLANLKKDFPMMRSFAKRMKQHHAGAPLPLFDLKAEGVLAGKLAGKLETAKLVFDSVDITKNLNAFEQSLDEAVENAVKEIAGRLKTTLAADIFEDDRTILTEMALDPSQAADFDARFKAALKRYDDNVFARIAQSQLAGRMAASSLKPLAREVDGDGSRISDSFRSRFGFGATPEKTQTGVRKLGKNFGVIFSDRTEAAKRRMFNDDMAIGLDSGRAPTGPMMQNKVRGLYADLFSPSVRKPGGLLKLLIGRASVLQTMLLDPALIDCVAVPGDEKNGDAVRNLVKELLNDIRESVNGGQLAPADFKAALSVTLKTSNGIFAKFSSGLAEAGAKVLTAMQKRLTAELTDVLRRLTASGANLKLEEKTLAELGASGLGSMDEGYGKFLANVLDHYFTSPKLAEDHDRMLESFFRNGKAGGTIGDALSALIKGAGPIFQKVLQSIPVDGLPDEIVKALFDVKSGLAPIPDSVIERLLKETIERTNSDEYVTNKIEGVEVLKSIGAASVGQAILCKFYFQDGTSVENVVKLRRDGIVEIAEREREFFKAMAGEVGDSMMKTFDARMDGIMEELDFNNEFKWIIEGRCYGEAANYGSAAYLKRDTGKMSVNSMKVSSLVEHSDDVLILEVAPGKPMDRSLRDTRGQFETLIKKITRKSVDGNGNPITVYQTKSGYDLIDIRGRLIDMYNGLFNQRLAFDELVRRFSSELFHRNYYGKDEDFPDCGGFMHGDLHGGNILVDGGRISVIDFGNSHKFVKEQRQQLVRFVAACGVGNASAVMASICVLLGKKSSEIPNYKDIVKDIQVIISKGDANDVVSRGMAVVQYLQRNNVQVPGPIINFTETVMRLATAQQEIAALMSDIASVITDLKIDPKANPLFDPYAAHPDLIFKNYAEDLFMSGSSSYDQFARNIGEITKLRKRMDDPKYAVTREEYDRLIAPALDMLRESTIRIGVNGTIGADVRAIERKLKALGDRLFAPGSIRDEGLDKLSTPAELFDRLHGLISTARGASITSRGNYINFVPADISTINECMSVGLGQFSEGQLLDIIGFVDSTKIIGKAKSEGAKAQHTLQFREIAANAQALLQRKMGVIATRVRRSVDRIIDDHFIWSPGLPNEVFSKKKWVSDRNCLETLMQAVKLNLGKLRSGLEASGIRNSEELEKYAMIAFSMKFGLAEALYKLDDASFSTLVGGLDAETADIVRFLRGDAVVVNAMRIGRSAIDAQKHVDSDTLREQYVYTQTNFAPMPEKSRSGWNDPANVRQTVTEVSSRYALLVTHLNVAFKKAEKRDDMVKDAAQYAMMRYLLEEGLLDGLAALDQKTLKTVLGQFGAKPDGSKALQELMTQIVGFMSA